MAGVLNVNRATEAELRLLPGIGRGRARAIVERREKRPFASLEELARMKGMKGVVRKLRAHLAVEGETTLRPAAP
jgi:competence protein ComEA